MKIHCRPLLAAPLLVVSITGFVPLHSGVRTSALQPINGVPGGYDPMRGIPPVPVAEPMDPVDITLANMFPTDIPMRKMQGGGTVRTWDIPPEAERLYYYVRTNGRPLKALVELVSSKNNVFYRMFGRGCVRLKRHIVPLHGNYTRISGNDDCSARYSLCQQAQGSRSDA
jgi:hypothetical protein